MDLYLPYSLILSRVLPPILYILHRDNCKSLGHHVELGEVRKMNPKKTMNNESHGWAIGLIHLAAGCSGGLHGLVVWAWVVQAWVAERATCLLHTCVLARKYYMCPTRMPMHARCVGCLPYICLRAVQVTILFCACALVVVPPCVTARTSFMRVGCSHMWGPCVTCEEANTCIGYGYPYPYHMLGFSLGQDL